MFFKNIPDKEISFVKSILLSYCASDYGKANVNNLSYFPNISDIEREIRRINISEEIIDKHKDLKTQPVPNITETVNRIFKFDYIGEEEVGKIFLTLKTVELYIRKFLSLGIFSEIFDIHIEFSIFFEIISFLSRYLSFSGYIKDDATFELKNIMAEKELTRQKIHEKIEQILKSKKKFLQEQFFVFRDGRYVLPVKTNFKKDFHGIVRDTSQSGDTLFMEPFELIDLNDHLFLLQKVEEKEKIKILKNITNFLKNHVDTILKVLEVYGYWDFINAKVEYKKTYKLNFPGFNNSGICLKSALHPVLMVKNAVPNDFIMDTKNKKVLLITGPNGGGKTVALKTIASIYSLTYMGIPTSVHKDSFLVPFEKFYFDILDIQDVEHGVSSFTAKMMLWKEILDNADSKTLIIIDEMGSYTNPQEGSAISCAFLLEILKKKTTAIIGTHLDQIKEFFAENKECELASFIWDERTLKPTYKIAYGTYSSSYAIDVLKSLGFDSYFIEQSLKLLSSDYRNIKDLNEKYRKKLFELEKKNKEVDLLREELKNILEQRKEIFKNFKRKLLEMEKNYNDKISEMIRFYEQKTNDVRVKRDTKDIIANLHKDLEKASEIIKLVLPHPKNEFNIGDRVYIKSLNKHGKVLEISKNKIYVMVGDKKMLFDKNQLYEAFDEKEELEKKEDKIIPINYHNDERVNVIDLKGLKVDEAISLLDKFIDNAYLLGMNKIRIIHGAGKGGLKKFVLEYLKTNRLVKNIIEGNYQIVGGGYYTEVEL